MARRIGPAPLLVLGLAGCGVLPAPTHDPALLAAASTPEDIRALLPPDEVMLPAVACASGGAADTLRKAEAVHEVCGLSELASAHDFGAAAGDRMEAARAYLFLRDSDPSEAARIGRILLGPPVVPADADAPAAPGLPSLPVTEPVRIDERIATTGAWGPYPYWHVPGFERGNTVLLDKDLDVGTLRHALASSGGELRLVVRSDAWTVVPIIAVREPLEPAGMGSVVDHGEVAIFAPPDDLDVQSFVAQLAEAGGRPVALDLSHRPCGEAPGPGMRCVPGAGRVGTFWIDEAATADTRACYARGACRSVPGTWRAARELCSYLGKRLPTSFEAERAALSDTPTWTATWQGEAEPPRGVCDGSPYCNVTNRKLLTDGSARAFQQPLDAPVRCATDKPWLTAWPSAGWDQIPDEPALPEPAPEQAKVAAAITPDPLQAKGICGEEVRATWIEELRRGGRSTVECRDPQSYVTSNEPDRFLFGRLIRNLGHGYVGVGSDQAYDFIAAARSEWAWVYDYDPNVVRLHEASQPLLRAARDRQDYVALWQDPDRAIPLIEAAYPSDRAGVLTGFYQAYRRRLHRHYTRQLRGHPELPEFGWLATDRNFAWIKTLAEQRRIVPTPLDLLGSQAMRSVGAQARELGVPIRVFYTSNAPTAWGGQATPDYKKNVLALPFDDQTRVIATTNRGGFDQEGRWHYNVMDGLLFQQRMASDFYRFNHQPMWDRIPGDHGNLTVLGLRSAAPATAAP